MLANKNLILLDLDGVVVDSRRNMECAWAEVRQRLNVSVGFDSYFALIGRSFRDIIARLGLSALTEEIEEVYRVASTSHLDLITFYPGAVQALVQMHDSGLKLGIVTSKDRLRSSSIIAHLPVELAQVQTPDPRYRGKPAPDHLLAAMAEASTDPDQTVFVGDMDVDFEAASRAHIDYVHAAWGYGKRPKECELSAQHFSQLPALFGVGPR